MIGILFTGVLLSTGSIGTNELALGLAVLSLIGNIVQGFMNGIRDVKLATIKNDSEDLHKEIELLKIELENAQAENKKWSDDNQKLRERIIKLESKIKDLTVEIEKRDKLIEKLTKKDNG